MPCLPIMNSRGTKRIGFVCVGNEPVAIQYRGTTYRFELTAASGWMPVNRDGSERLSRVPKGAWEALLAAEAKGEREKEAEALAAEEAEEK